MRYERVRIPLVFALAMIAPAHAPATVSPVVAATYFRYVPGQVGGAIELLEGSSLLLTHADPIPVFLGWTPWHDIISRAETEDGEPLFSSPFLAFGETAVVQGVDALPRGTYPFYCSTHVGEGMMGELVIV